MCTTKKQNGTIYAMRAGVRAAEWRCGKKAPTQKNKGEAGQRDVVNATRPPRVMQLVKKLP